MDYLRNLINSHKNRIILLVIATIVELVIFGLWFGFHANNDTDSFISISRFFRGEEVLIFPNRYLNPLYPVLSATILAPVSPAASIIITNIVFYFGVVLLTYGLVRRVFGEKVGLMSSLLIMTAYPMVRYALTQVQDMGGYFWFTLTLYTGWRWWQEKKISWLFLGGVATAFGLLTKESGAMGAIFVGILIVINSSSLFVKVKQLAIFSILPFLTLLINQWRGKEINYNSGRWFIENWHVYAPTNYTWLKWFGVNATTYNILWVAIIIGVLFLIKKWRTISKDVKLYLLAVLIPSISYLSWPIFIGRTVFISAWFLVPIAAYGLVELAQHSLAGRRFAVTLFCLALLTPSLLQHTLRYAHVFDILDRCQRNLICSWEAFWHSRGSISTEL